MTGGNGREEALRYLHRPSMHLEQAKGRMNEFEFEFEFEFKMKLI